MSSVRHRQLSQLLAFVVALNMAVGVVALSARRVGRHRVKTTLVAGSVGIPLNDKTGVGILAGAKLEERRASKRTSGSTASTQPSATTSRPGISVAAGTAASTTTSSSASATVSRPATTGGAVPVAPSTSGTTAMSRPAGGETTTTRPVGTSSTTTSTARPRQSAPASSPSPTSPSSTAARPAPGDPLTDPAGDTFVDGTRNAIKEGRADIVRAAHVYRRNVIGLAFQVSQPVDPRQDERWAGDSTLAAWEVDTTNDGKPDYEVQYFVLEGNLGGSVSRLGETDVACDAAEALYGADGYALAIDPGCLGNPESFSYRLTMYYDTNPKDESADVASDVTPNGGWSFPIRPTA